MNNSNLYLNIKKVSEKEFPDEGQEVIIYSENGMRGTAIYTDGSFENDNYHNFESEEVIEWAPIPERNALPSETKEVKESAEEVYNRVTLEQVGNNPIGTRMDIVYESMRQYHAQFNQSVPVSRWISVVSKPEKDLNPAYSVEVLVSVDKLYAGRLPLYGIGQYDFEHDCWLHLTFEPSHWMPLPQKP